MAAILVSKSTASDSIHRYGCLTVCLSVCLSVFLSVHLFYMLFWHQTVHEIWLCPGKFFPIFPIFLSPVHGLLQLLTYAGVLEDVHPLDYGGVLQVQALGAPRVISFILISIIYLYLGLFSIHHNSAHSLSGRLCSQLISLSFLNDIVWATRGRC